MGDAGGVRRVGLREAIGILGIRDQAVDAASLGNARALGDGNHEDPLEIAFELDFVVRAGLESHPFDHGVEQALELERLRGGLRGGPGGRDARRGSAAGEGEGAEHGEREAHGATGRGQAKHQFTSSWWVWVMLECVTVSMRCIGRINGP
ncbi:hypothetical protein D3C72_1907650 [compost metagenome]